jgi:hypothetical protein
VISDIYRFVSIYNVILIYNVNEGDKFTNLVHDSVKISHAELINNTRLHSLKGQSHKTNPTKL